MKKKFLFINLCINCGWNTGINHGIAFLSPVVKKRSFDVACLNLQREMDPVEFRKIIKQHDPSIVGFSLTSHQIKYLIKYSRELDQYPDILQIAGGVGSTLDPETILLQTSVKGACIGEGDIPLTRLLDTFSAGKNIYDTEGFFWKKNNSIKKNPIPQFVSDISTLDFPDYSVFDRKLVTNRGDLNIMLSRGCPFNCYYCCTFALKSVYPSPKGYFRIPSVEYSVNLIKTLCNYYPETRFISFEDDILIADKEWFKEFAARYKKSIHLPYRACVRIEYITPETAALLKDSGCRFVLFGIESGSEYIRRHLLNRKHSNSTILEKSKIIKQAGLALHTFNITGFPLETKKEMEETLELNHKIEPDGGHCFFFYPYKGTELYEICKKNNLLKRNEEMYEITNYNTKPAIKMTRKKEKNCLLMQKKLNEYLFRKIVRTGNNQ